MPKRFMKLTPGLTRKHYTKVEGSARDKNSTLIVQLVNLKKKVL